jgi:hypothetical protein
MEVTWPESPPRQAEACAGGGALGIRVGRPARAGVRALGCGREIRA